MATTIFDGNVRVTGSFTASSMSISNTDIASATPSTGISVEKVQHLIIVGTDFGFDDQSQPLGDVRRTLFVSAGVCEIRIAKAGLYDTGTTTDIDFNILLDGTSILSSAINVTHSIADKLPVAGTIATATMAAGQWLVATMTITANTGAKGPFCWIEIDQGAN